MTNPSGRAGRFHAYVGDEMIVTSRQPFLDGARALLDRGHPPTTPYNMRHENSDTQSFVTTTIGHAAGLSVNDARTRFQKLAPAGMGHAEADMTVRTAAARDDTDLHRRDMDYIERLAG